MPRCHRKCGISDLQCLIADAKCDVSNAKCFISHRQCSISDAKYATGEGQNHREHVKNPIFHRKSAISDRKCPAAGGEARPGWHICRFPFTHGKSSVQERHHGGCLQGLCRPDGAGFGLGWDATNMPRLTALPAWLLRPVFRAFFFAHDVMKRGGGGFRFRRGLARRQFLGIQTRLFALGFGRDGQKRRGEFFVE